MLNISRKIYLLFFLENLLSIYIDGIFNIYIFKYMFFQEDNK